MKEMILNYSKNLHFLNLKNKKNIGYLAFQKAKIEKFLSWLFQKAGLGSQLASLFWLPSPHKTHV